MEREQMVDLLKRFIVSKGYGLTPNANGTFLLTVGSLDINVKICDGLPDDVERNLPGNGCCFKFFTGIPRETTTARGLMFTPEDGIDPDIIRLREPYYFWKMRDIVDHFMYWKRKQDGKPQTPMSDL